MARALISLHIGHAGAHVGDAAWALALQEHGAWLSAGGGCALCCARIRIAAHAAA
jgi:hypothetical protein